MQKADLSLVGDITNHNAFEAYLKSSTSHNENAFQVLALQSLSQIHRPLWQFESLLKKYVEQNELLVDTSNVWAMAYLNIKVGIKANLTRILLTRGNSR